MGAVLSWHRRDDVMPDENSGGNDHDTDVDGSIPESADVSRYDEEIGARGPAPTHVITQPEDGSKNLDSVSPGDSVDVEGNEDGIKDLVLGPTHISDPVSDHHDILPPTGLLRVGVARNGDQVPIPHPTPITEPEVESSRKRKRAPNWEPLETETLIKSKLQNLNWDQISDRISDRSSTQCRRRWDTVVKPYKKVKRHCVALGKDVSHVTEQELRSMKVGTDYARSRHWFEMIDDWFSSKSGVPPNDPNEGILAIGTVGENALPVASIVVVPDVVTTAPPVQATGVGAAVRFPHVCLQWKVVLQIVSFISCLCLGAVGTGLRVVHLNSHLKVPEHGNHGPKR